MKMTSMFTALALVLALALPQKSHAFGLCNTENTVDGCWNGREAFWLTSTTFTGPLALIVSGELDMSRPEVKEMAVSQAKLIVAGNGSQINESENIVRVLAYTYGVSEAKMAEAILKLAATDAKLTDENIRKALNSL